MQLFCHKKIPYLEFLQQFYKENVSLESAFASHLTSDDQTVEKALNGFYYKFYKRENNRYVSYL